MQNTYWEIFGRNLGFVSESGQDKLKKSTVGIAGVGGVGGLLAERLIRLGVGAMKISDPGVFSPSGINRQFLSSSGTLGMNKAEVISSQLRDISPEARIQFSNAGIKTQEDAELFVDDCALVIDEMDFGSFTESVFLQRAARKKGLYYMFAAAIGFGAITVIFDPRGMTLEEYNGFNADTTPDDYDFTTVPLERICPVIPSYAADMPVEILNEVLTAGRPGPTTSIGVGLASILAANEAANILLGNRDIPSAPHYTYVDLVDRKFVVGTVS